MEEHGIVLNKAAIYNESMPVYSLRAIGLLESVFKEKNGTPRQVCNSGPSRSVFHKLIVVADLEYFHCLFKGAVVPASKARLKISLENNCQHTLEGLNGR